MLEVILMTAGAMFVVSFLVSGLLTGFGSLMVPELNSDEIRPPASTMMSSEISEMEPVEASISPTKLVAETGALSVFSRSVTSSICC